MPRREGSGGLEIKHLPCGAVRPHQGGAWARAFQGSEPWAEHAAPGFRAHTDPLPYRLPRAAQKTGLRWRARGWGGRQLERAARASSAEEARNE